MDTLDTSGLTPEQARFLAVLAAMLRRQNVEAAASASTGRVARCWVCEGRKGPLDPLLDGPNYHELCAEKGR